MASHPRITLTRPDDLHLHLRDDESLRAVLPYSVAQFARAIVMPNLVPPVSTTARALAYRDRILAALPAGSDFQPLMTLYLTDATSPAEIRTAAASGEIHAVKLYPAGATTNAAFGVTRVDAIHPALEAMSETRLPLLVHGEVTDPDVDVFDRERVFIERVLEPLRRVFPELRIVVEHVTTTDGVQYVQAHEHGVAATITPQHLLFNRNALFAGGLRPHHYCLPLPKREHDRLSLIGAATSGDPRFFLGTDSAPHARSAKESACGCAGVFSAHAALELYAEIFEAADALERLEAFASHHGADFYGLPRNTGRIALRRQSWTVPETLPLGDGELVPLRAGETMRWRLDVAEDR